VSNVVPFPGETPPTDGGGSEDPLLLERVSRLEDSLKTVDRKLGSIETTLARIEGQLGQMPKATDFGEVKGRVAGLPTWWQMLAMVVSVWGAGAAIVFVVIKYTAQ